MIEKEDARRVVDTIAKNLMGIANNMSNFERLPDRYWGYYARGHDTKGTLGVIVVYSEDTNDVDELIKMYNHWAAKNKTT